VVARPPPRGFPVTKKMFTNKSRDLKRKRRGDQKMEKIYSLQRMAAWAMSLFRIFLLFNLCIWLISVNQAVAESLADTLVRLVESPEEAQSLNPPGFVETLNKLSLSPEDRGMAMKLPYQLKKIGVGMPQKEADILVKLNKNPGTIKFACMAPLGTPWAKYIREVPKAFRKRMGDIIRIESYIGLSLGNDPDYVRKMASGSLEAAGITTWGMKYISKEIGVYELPFLFETYGEADYVVKKTWPVFVEKFREKGFVLVPTPMEVGFLQVYSTKKIIKTPDDLLGAKYGCWMGDVEIATIKQLGINPVVFTVLELPSSLATNIIQSQSSPTMYMVGAQILSFIEKGGGCSGVNMFYPPGGLVYKEENMINAALSNITKSEQQVLIKYVDEITAMFNEMLEKVAPMLTRELREGNKKLIESLQQKGMAVYIPSMEERKIWKQKTRPVWDELVGKIYSQETLDRVLKAKSEYRATHPEEFESYKWEP